MILFIYALLRYLSKLSINAWCWFWIKFNEWCIRAEDEMSSYYADCIDPNALNRSEENKEAYRASIERLEEMRK